MSDILILDEEKKTQDGLISWLKDSNKNLHGMKWISFMDTLNNMYLSMQNIKLKEKLIFYRLLSTMLNSWMWLIKGIWVLEKQEKNPVFKKILNHLIAELREWNTLSDALEQFPNSFSDAEIWIIKSWEKTWKLNSVLSSLADQTEKVSSMSGKLKSALMYPLMILVIVFGVIFVMMTSIVPKLLEIFDNKDALPPSTKALIAISDFLLLQGNTLLTVFS